MNKGKRPYVLSIAGFDPSGGAGVLADIKVFEACKTIGLGVATSITYQNESEFAGVKWLSLAEIKNQLKPLLAFHKPEFVKIGLIKDLKTLHQLIQFLKKTNKDVKLIWDPILKASAGFEFHSEIEKNLLDKVTRNLFLVTPNALEICTLTGKENPYQGAELLSNNCKVYLKGGHIENDMGRDFLFENGSCISFRPKAGKLPPKHGSGCVLSSAVAAHLAKGYKLKRACLEAKDYVTKFLSSNPNLLGYHKF